MSLTVFDIEKYVDGFGNVVEPDLHYTDGTIRYVLHNVLNPWFSPLVFAHRCHPLYPTTRRYLTVVQPSPSVQVHHHTTVREERSSRRFSRVVKSWHATSSLPPRRLVAYPSAALGGDISTIKVDQYPPQCYFLFCTYRFV